MIASEPNRYSAQWFEFFHIGIPESRTKQETNFIQTSCPLPSFQKIVDVCCGMGRHSRALAAEGYSVTGIERNILAIKSALEKGGGPVYIQSDIREYQPSAGSFDAAIIMSQSFGLFDVDTNRHILHCIAKGLRPNGRIILDLWNPDFFIKHQGQREFKLPNGIVRESKHMRADRLFVQLDYPDGHQDKFEWQTFSIQQMSQFSRPLGLSLIQSCTDFDISAIPASEKPKIQFILERSCTKANKALQLTPSLHWSVLLDRPASREDTDFRACAPVRGS